MALITCTQCGSLVSNKGKFCPICGKPVPEILAELNGDQEPGMVPPEKAESPVSPATDEQVKPETESPVNPAAEEAAEPAAEETVKLATEEPTENPVSQPVPPPAPTSPAPEAAKSSRPVVGVIAFVLIFLLVLICAGFFWKSSTHKVENKKARAEREVRERVEQWSRYCQSHDAASLLNMYSLSVRYVSKVYSNEEMYTTYVRSFSDYPGWGQSISDLQVTPLSETIYKAHFTLHHWGGKRGSSVLPANLCLELQDGQWKIIRQSDEVSDSNIAKMYQKKLTSMRVLASDGRYTYYLNRDSKKNLSTLYRWDYQTGLFEVILNAGPEGCRMLPISKSITSIDAVEEVIILDDGRLLISGKRSGYGGVPVYLFDILSGRCDYLGSGESAQAVYRGRGTASSRPAQATGGSSSASDPLRSLRPGSDFVLKGTMDAGTKVYQVTLTLSLSQGNWVEGTYHDHEDYFSVEGYLSNDLLELHGFQGRNYNPWTFTLKWNRTTFSWLGDARRDDKSFSWPMILRFEG